MAIDTSHLDSGSDKPKDARVDLLAAVVEVNRVGPVADAVSARVPAGLQFRPCPPETGYVCIWQDPVTLRAPLRLTVAGTLETDSIALPASVVARATLTSDLQALVPIALPPESGYVWALADPVTLVAPVRLSITGSLEVDSITLGSGTVSRANLTSDLLALIPVSLPPESGYVWALQDPVTKICPVRVTTTGVLEADSYSPSTGSVSPASFTDSAKRQALPELADVQPVLPTSPLRSKAGQVAALTAPLDGSYWVRLPPAAVRLLRGPNGSGVSIDARRSAGLLFMGEASGGAWNPGSYPSSNYLGDVLGPGAVSAPSGTFAAGDYYLYANGSGTAGTYGGNAIGNGDVLVYDGSTWRIQAGPGSYAARNPRQWFSVSGAGTFDGVTYAVGDRIVYVGRQTGGGGPLYERWAKGDPTARGDLF